MDQLLRFRFHLGVNCGDITRIIENEGNCTVTQIYTSKIDENGPAVIENACKVVVCGGPGVDTIKELVKQKFPRDLIDIARLY